MVNTSRVKSLLDSVKEILMTDKPSFVKKLEFYIVFKDACVFEGNNIREGDICVYIETDTHYIFKDLYGYTASYGKINSKEDAEITIITDMKIIWETMIDNEEFKDFWNDIDFDSEEWKEIEHQ